MLLLSSSSPSSRGARTTQAVVQAPGASALKLIGAETAGSETEEAPSLRDLIEQHSAEVQEGKKAKAGRLALIKYEPKSAGEASLKLAYLTSYLIATKSTLTAREMKQLLTSRRSRSAQPHHSVRR